MATFEETIALAQIEMTEIDGTLLGSVIERSNPPFGPVINTEQEIKDFGALPRIADTLIADAADTKAMLIEEVDGDESMEEIYDFGVWQTCLSVRLAVRHNLVGVDTPAEYPERIEDGFKVLDANPSVEEIALEACKTTVDMSDMLDTQRRLMRLRTQYSGLFNVVRATNKLAVQTFVPIEERHPANTVAVMAVNSGGSLVALSAINMVFETALLKIAGEAYSMASTDNKVQQAVEQYLRERRQ